MFDAFAWNLKYAFRPRKPLLTARLVQAVIKARLGRRFLRYVDFSLDFRCNLKCQHCFATALEGDPTKGTGDRPTMSVEDYRRVARQAMDLGCVNFSFQGGEPLLVHNLREIIQACEPDRNVISVATNGILLTEAKVAELRAWGVDILTVSLDSGVPGEHDAFRGAPGAFDKTLAGVRRALAAGLRVTIATVVTHQSLHGQGLARMLDIARELKVLLYLILPVQAGNWTGSESMMLTEDDKAHIYDLCARTPWIRTDFEANFGPYGCGAAKEILYLTPYGDVLPCPFLHIAMGNVLEDDVEGIRARALDNPWFADYGQTCLVSTDKAFIDAHLSKTWGADHLPLPWSEAFPDQTGRDDTTSS